MDGYMVLFFNKQNGGIYHMKKKYHEPYGINIKYEFKTYQNIESNYWNRRKKHNQKRYKICNTYCDWEQHIKELIRKNGLEMQGQDFIHWLYQQRRNANGIVESTKAILIPIYIALPSLLNTIPDGIYNLVELFALQFFGSAFLFLIIMWVSIKFLRYEMKKTDFCDDVIAIMQKELHYQLPCDKF